MKTIDHIVLISLDTLRNDCISDSPYAYNFKKKYSTKITLDTYPIDQRMNNGRYYINNYSAAPYTAASHGAYFTGFWPLNNGVYEFYHRPLKKKTIFQLAKENQFKTIFQTDFPVILGDFLGLNRGVDNYFVEDEDAALKILRSNKAEKTLSFFHFGGIHYPYGFHNLKFGGTDYVKKVIDLEKYYGINQTIELEDTLNETYRDEQDKEYLFRYKRIVEFMYKNESFNELFDLYLEGINYFLKNRFASFLKKIVEFIDSTQGLLILFSDHGEEWDKVSYGHFNTINQGVINVPLIFYGKNILKSIEDSITRTIDLTPTLYEIITRQSIENYPFDGQKLQIFSKSNKERERIAFAQTWIDEDKQLLSKFQNSALAGNKVDDTLLHPYLFREVVISSHGKLERKFSNSKKLLNKTLTNFSSKKSAELSEYLEKQLNQYNQLLQNNQGEILSPPQSLKEQLVRMGYRI